MILNYCLDLLLYSNNSFLIYHWYYILQGWRLHDNCSIFFCIFHWLSGIFTFFKGYYWFSKYEYFESSCFIFPITDDIMQYRWNKPLFSNRRHQYHVLPIAHKDLCTLDIIFFLNPSRNWSYSLGKNFIYLFFMIFSFIYVSTMNWLHIFYFKCFYFSCIIILYFI